MAVTNTVIPEMTSFNIVEKPLVQASAKNTSANKTTKISEKFKPLKNWTLTFVDFGIILDIVKNSPHI